MILPKKNDKKEQLKAKYGVIKDIPKQPVEEDVKEAKKQETPESSNFDLILRIEKLEGKFSAFEDVKDDINERISRLSEEIGELRSSFLELDKNFTSLESKVEKTLESVKELEPEKIFKEMSKKETEIIKLQAEAETMKSILSNIKKDNEKLFSILEKIKNIENLVNMYKKLSEKIQMIDDTKIYVDRLAGKSETIFSEMESKMKDIEDIKAKTQKLDDLTVDIVKMLDGLSLKVPKLIEKDAAQKYIEESVKKMLQELSKNYYLEMKKMFENEKNQIKQEINSQILKTIQESTKSTQDSKNSLEAERQKIAATLDEVKILIDSLKSKSFADERIEACINFLQSVSMLSLLSEKNEIEHNLERIKNLKNTMVRLGVWSDEDHEFLMKTLLWLSNTWEYYGNAEIKKLIDQKMTELATGA
jgi:chromosome segregation ATPase